MKRITFLGFLLAVFILTSCNNSNQEKKQNKSNTQPTSISKIEVIDFHSTHRCMTCNAIEENTKYTLDTYFSEELKDGEITFKTINVDEEVNETLAEKFQATGTSLFLNVVKNGKEKHVDLTEFAFMHGRDKEEFSSRLKEKIDEELANL